MSDFSDHIKWVIIQGCTFRADSIGKDETMKKNKMTSLHPARGRE
jgi:hypothetical protein